MHCRKVKLKSGEERWECYADAPPDPVTGKRRQIKRRGKTQREAKKRVERAIRSLEDDNIDEALAKKITFEQAARHWLDVYSMTGVKNNTLRSRKYAIQVLNRYFAKSPLANITPIRYQKMINDVFEKYSKATIELVNGTAGLIFKQAIKDKIIKENPKEGVVIPREQKTIKDIETNPIEEKYLERWELEEFLEAVREHGLKHDKEWFYLLAFSGMRVGEMLSLKWSDINFTTNEIRIIKTLYNPNNNMREYELTPPKTMGSIRTIVMEDEIMDVLKEHRKQQTKLKMKYRHQIDDYHDENFVFCRTNGYPFSQHDIWERMKRLVKRTNIKKNASPHILRHTHISMLTEANVDIATIMERVGHEDMKTTMNIYTHVTKKMKQDASEKVKRLFGDDLFKLKSVK